MVVYLLTRKVVHYDSMFYPLAVGFTEDEDQAWLHGPNVMVPRICCADEVTHVRFKVSILEFPLYVTG